MFSFAIRISSCSLLFGGDAAFEEVVEELADFGGAAADQAYGTGAVTAVSHFAVETVHEDVDEGHLFFGVVGFGVIGDEGFGEGEEAAAIQVFALLCLVIQWPFEGPVTRFAFDESEAFAVNDRFTRRTLHAALMGGG